MRKIKYDRFIIIEYQANTGLISYGSLISSILNLEFKITHLRIDISVEVVSIFFYSGNKCIMRLIR